MPYGDFLRSFMSGLGSVRKAILNDASYYAVGSLEVGATIIGEPKVLSLPVFEGETQYSNISQYLMGHSVTIRCKINLFSNSNNAFILLAKIANPGTAIIKGDSKTLYEEGFIGYFYRRLASKLYVSDGGTHSSLNLFGLVNVLGPEEYEYFILLNPHVSMPAHVFPVGGTPATLSLDVFSDGPGLAIHRYCKLGAGVVGGGGGGGGGLFGGVASALRSVGLPFPFVVDPIVSSFVFGQQQPSNYANIVDSGPGAHGGRPTFKFKDPNVGNSFVCDQMVGVAPLDVNIIAVFGASRNNVFRSNYSIVTF